MSIRPPRSAAAVLALAAAMVAVCLALTACGAPPPLATDLPYADDFSDPTSGWETLSDVSAEVRYDNGALRFYIKQENLTQWSNPGKTFTDGVYEVDAITNGGPTDNGFGVLFRYQDRKNFYHFEISSDGYWRAGMMKDGQWVNWEDWSGHPNIRTGQAVNRLKVVMQGDTFTFFINDQQVSQRQDATFESGDIGLFAMTLIDGPGTDVSFDRVSVTEVPDE